MTHNVFEGKQILLGVTGSIACYKAVDLASKLTQMGAAVNVVLTKSACRFVSGLSFSSVTGRQAHSDLWDESSHIRHVSLGESADLVVVAPATAHTIAKMANGLADNLLSVTLLTARCPLLVAPAMDGGMYAHPATQENVKLLKDRGVVMIGPAEGRMASGLTGLGRMVEPGDLIGHIRYHLGRRRGLSGKRVLVTAGPTREPLDPVRFLSNRSSGKQGIALAQAALDTGADVTLIAGPIQVQVPVGVEYIQVQSAQEMCDEVLEAVSDVDVLLMAAAVSDFRPEKHERQKIKKDNFGDAVATLSLDRNPDILREVKKRKNEHNLSLFVVGFAAETSNILEYGRNKLQDKGMDLIAINDVSASDAGFEVDSNRITLISNEGWQLELPLQSKEAVAFRILDEVVKHFDHLE